MAVYIDPPTWPGHGRNWSHLISDTSYAELHAFAERLGAPSNAFERDHYDIPESRYAEAVRLGAVEVGPRELLRRLTEAGLRRRKHPHPRYRPNVLRLVHDVPLPDFDGDDETP
ncbi:DUF4031 domain-containing protein [Actinacidiphila sp. ITFR-21]|uniref:DUF4031 domain-containing protein n=1 Tax=Actinacidiphila sp. ITFR-21 TaxID=3075199 RepID=UPI00288AB08F|nr:DUF4031 domain-containing protein [Streptomyces sp. ITFR-21]WNI16034.1 DUF4031 domain-containing protein [Streptomyces sp. ITFR-21]